MKFSKYVLLLSILTFSCQQNYVEKSSENTSHGKFKTNRDWWPNQLDLSVLRKHSNLSDPMGENFNYEKEFKGAKINLVKGIRGENKGAIGMVWIFESNEARDLYYDSNGAPTKLNQEVNQRLRTVNEGLSKIGTWTSKYTDWSVY